MPTISLGRALADPNLFARHFRNKSWAGWKTFSCGRCLPSLQVRTTSTVYRARTGRTAWPTAAVHRGGGDCRPAGRQEPDPGVDCGLFGRLPRLRAVSGPGRGGDDRGAGGRQGAGAGDLPVCDWVIEGGADAGAADRAGGTPRRSSCRIGFISRSPRRRFAARAATAMRRSCATRSRFGAATRRRSTPMSKFCARCGLAWRRSRVRCC